MALRRRGPGIGGLKKSESEKQKFESLGNDLESSQIEVVKKKTPHFLRFFFFSWLPTRFFFVVVFVSKIRKTQGPPFHGR